MYHLRGVKPSWVKNWEPGAHSIAWRDEGGKVRDREICMISELFLDHNPPYLLVIFAGLSFDLPSTLPVGLSPH